MDKNTEKQINYLIESTDNIGLVEHCNGSIPNYEEGWCVDDNARGLQVCLRYDDILSLKELKIKYFNFLKLANRNNNFYNDLNQDMTWKEGFMTGGEHCSRALLALGELIEYDDELKNEAIKLFNKIYKIVKKNNKKNWVRVAAGTILGLQNYRSEEINYWAEKIVEKYNLEKSDNWRWFEDEITYDNGRIPMSLLVAYQQTKNKKYLEVAIESLDFLTNLTFDKNNNFFSFPGNRGWFTKTGNRAKFDQQPIEAGTMVEVYVLAYEVTKNEKYKKLAKTALDWYFGKNILKLKLINNKTGGVHDGINIDGKINPDQGAESLLSYLLAAKEIEKLYLT